MNLTLVIPTHNRHREIALLIESIRIQILDKLQIELIIVSNLVDQKLGAWVREIQNTLSFTVRYYEVGSVGVNAARNLGLNKALSKKVYFLDDDVILPHPYHLKTIFDMAELNSWANAIGGGYEFSGRSALVDEVYHAVCTSWLKEGRQDSDEMVYLVGGNTLYNLEITQGDLRFNEQITFGGSETELNLRLYVAGNKNLYSESLNIIHATNLNAFSLAKKALRQGMGRSFHEQIVPSSFWKVNSTGNSHFLREKISGRWNYYLASWYLSLYSFFFHVGYRHGKRQKNGPLSQTAVLICMFQTFFQIDSDKILYIPNPQAIPFHKKDFPSLKFKELHHWFKANVWWKIPNYGFHFVFKHMPNYIFWKIIPSLGNIVLSGVEKFLPINTVKIRNFYFRIFKKL